MIEVLIFLAVIILSAAVADWLFIFRPARFAWRWGMAILTCSCAVFATRKFLSLDSMEYRNIPWGYLRFWLVFWWTLFVLSCIPAVQHKMWYGIAKYFKYLVKIWGPQNEPSKYWFWMAVFSITMLFLQGIPSAGPDLEEVKAQGFDLEKIRSFWVEGKTVLAPPYPKTWLWFWLISVSLLMSIVSLFLTRRDELKDIFRRVWEKRKALAQVAAAGVTPTGPAPAAPVPPAPAHGGFWYTVKHLTYNVVGEFLAKLVGIQT